MGPHLVDVERIAVAARSNFGTKSVHLSARQTVHSSCFSTVLLEVKHTDTSRACVSDLVPLIYHNLYKLVLDT